MGPPSGNIVFRLIVNMAPPVLVGTVLGLLCVVGARTEETSITEEFDVKPGGVENTYNRTLGSFSCKFTYAAQGGTNEKWQMTIEMKEDKQYFFCTIWRPLGTSYLFFLKFKVEVTGGRIKFCEAYSQENKPLKKSEYDVTDTAVHFGTNDVMCPYIASLYISRALLGNLIYDLMRSQGKAFSPLR